MYKHGGSKCFILCISLLWEDIIQYIQIYIYTYKPNKIMKNLINKSLSTFSMQVKRSGEIKKVLVTGANGQLGQGLGPHLEELYGKNNVMFSDLHEGCKREGVDNY